MSGGDVDGDEYFITWERTIVDNFKEKDPMDYTAGEE